MSDIRSRLQSIKSNMEMMKSALENNDFIADCRQCGAPSQKNICSYCDCELHTDLIPCANIGFALPEPVGSINVGGSHVN